MGRLLSLWAAVGLLVLAGCGPDEPAVKPSVGLGVRLEAWCAKADLTPALRQTVIVIDERAIRPANAREMRTVNADLYELVTALGDPVGGRDSGTMAARERLTIYIAPADGGAPRMLLTGCAPGMTPLEFQEARGQRSAVANAGSDFMSGGLGQEIKEAQSDFRDAVLLALSRATREPAAGPIRAGGFTGGSLLASLRATRSLAPEGSGTPRFFLFTNLTAFPTATDRVAARTAGFAAARDTELNLGGAEVFLVGGGGAPQGLGRDFAQAFFLGAQGNLLSWGGATFNALPAAPVSVRTYAGEIIYPQARFPVRLIVGRDAQNRLVNSWLIVRSDSEWATPVGGSATCIEDVCTLAADRSGLAQNWSVDPDPEPEFTVDLPLSGMRNIKAELTAETASGEVSDPMVDSFEGAPAGVKTLTFNLAAL